MAQEFTYEIAGKQYGQKPLVLGQWRQFLDVIKGLSIPGNVDPWGLAKLLGDNLPLALAVVLNPEGVPLKDKDLPALADELEFAIGPETIISVIEDFFACNPLPSILERLSQAAGILSGMMKTETSLNPSLSPSQPETSPGETPSSGDTPSETSSPG